MSNRTRLAAAGLLLVAIVLGLAACGAEPEPTTVAQATTAPTEPPEPTEPPTQAPTDTVAPTDTIAPTDTVEPTDTPIPPTDTPEPTNTPEPVADDSGCITCHTSQETLQALAVEEEPAETLSEGEG